MPAQTTPHVDSQLLNKAITALMKHHENSSSGKALLGDEKTFHVQFSLDRVPDSTSPKPIPISIPHALYKLDDAAEGVQEPEVCIIVKEESKASVQEMIQQFPEHLGFVKKVLGLTSLRKKHARFEQQRALLARYDVFLADDRILPMLAKCIGRNFFAAKKQPIPIRITRKQALPFAIQQALKSTHLFISKGTCITIRGGNTAMPFNQIIENVAAIIEEAPQKMPRKWANVRSISIKTSDSMALPVYNKTPEEIAEIAKLAGIEETADAERLALEQKEAKNEKIEQKKRKAKSPLVQALKQMEEESEEKEERATKKAKKNATQKVKKSEDEPAEAALKVKEVVERSKRKERTDDGTKTTKAPETKKLKEITKAPETKNVKDTTEGALKGTNTSQTKKKAKQATSEAPKAAETKKEMKETSAKDDMETSKTSESKKKVKGSPPVVAQEALRVTKETDEKKTKQRVTKNETKEKMAKKTEEMKDFIASTKFMGSKSGMVFRKGPKGVGYYIDVKPVVDKMAMQALMRVGKSSPGGGGGGSGKKSKRGRR